MAETNTNDPNQHVPHTPPQPAPKPRKRRRWPWVILALFVLLILLILLTPTILSTGVVRSMVIGKINDHLNGKLGIADWSFGWTSGVTLNAIQIDDEKGRRILEVASVRMSISLIGAARGNYDLGDVVIDKPNLVNLELYPDGSNNLQKLMKEQMKDAGAKQEKSTGQSKLLDVKGKITINEARGTITRLSPPGEPFIPPVFIDPSNLVINIPSINSPIENTGKIVYRVGTAPAGTITLAGTVDAIENNQIDLNKLKADQTLIVADADFAAAAPFMQKPGEKVTLAGVANGTLQIKAEGLNSASVAGELNGTNFAFGGTPLKGDTYATSKIAIPINITTTSSGGATLIKIQTLKIETDQAIVDVSGQATKESLQNLAANKPPGADGQLAVDIKTKDLPGLINPLRNAAGLQQDVELKSGEFKTRVDVKLAADRAVVTQTLDLTAAGTNQNRPITLDPVHLDTNFSALYVDGKMHDLVDIAINLASAFANAKGGGTSLAGLDINGNMDLAKLHQQIAQFMDLGTLNFAGTGTFRVTSKGDLTKAGEKSDISANVTLANVRVSGMRDKPEMNQPRLALESNAKIVRGNEQFIEKIETAKIVFQTGEASAPVIDLLVNATGVTPGESMGEIGVEKFEVSRMSIPDLGLAQQQFAAFLPASFRATHGSLNAVVTGSFLNKTLVFDQTAQIRGLALQKLDENNRMMDVIAKEDQDIAMAGKVVMGDLTQVTLTTLSAVSSNGLFTIKKGGEAPLVIEKRNDAIGGSGELTISSDLKRVNDVLLSMKQAPVVTTSAGELISGVFDATLKLAKNEKGSDINFNGAITNLSVTTQQQPTQPETVTINFAASTPADSSGIIIVRSAVLDSSFAKTTLTDAELQRNGGTFDMLRKAHLVIAIPDLAKTYAVAQAFSPPSTQPVDPKADPIEPLQIGGGAVVNLELSRDQASQTTHITIPQLAASKVSLTRGKRSFALPKPINIKLIANLAAADRINQIDIKQLEGDLGGLATLNMPAPISVANFGDGGRPIWGVTSGKIALAGAVEPLTRLLSVLQGADPMPYTGEYAINQNVATDAGKIKLAGDATINKFVVLSEGKPSFTEDKIVLSNDLLADMDAKSATINGVVLDMASSKAAGVALRGTITQWDTQRALNGVTCDLSYDLEKIWQLAKPMLSSETQKNYDDLKIAGVYKKTFNFSGSFPANAANDWHESIKSLNADGALGIQHLYTSGLDLQNYELPITMERGVVTTVYANKPKTERVPKPAIVNGGSGDFGSMLVDLTGPSPMLSIGKNQQLLKDVQLNPIFADKIGKFAAVIFKDPKEATGRVDCTVIECQNVPLGDLMMHRNNGRAKVDLKIHDLRLNSFILSAIAKATMMGDNGITGEVRDSNIVYAGSEGGFTRSQINIFLTRKGVQYPLSFSGGILLGKLELHDAVVSIPPQLLGSDDLTHIFPNGMKLPIGGTTESPKLDTSSLIKDNITGVLGNVLGGNKNDSKGADGDKKSDNPLGGIFDQIGGNKKSSSPKAQEPPSARPTSKATSKPAPPPTTPKKKKK